MNLILRRTAFTSDGIFGAIFDETNDQLFRTLEHAYSLDDTVDAPLANVVGVGFLPKVPAGKYTCVRGQHKLKSTPTTFTTFEITGVPGHSGILFHPGNFDGDSEGCILLGVAVALDAKAQPMLVNSRRAFEAFMELQGGLDSFELIVA